MLESHEIEMDKQDIYRSNKTQNKNDQSSNYSKTIIKLFVDKIRQLIKISFSMLAFQRSMKQYEYLAAKRPQGGQYMGLNVHVMCKYISNRVDLVVKGPHVQV